MPWNPPYGQQTPPQQAGGQYMNPNPNINPYNPPLQNPPAPYPYPGAPVPGHAPQPFQNHPGQSFRQPGGPQHAPPPQQQAQFTPQYPAPHEAVPRSGSRLPNQPYQQAGSYMPHQPPQQVYSGNRSVASSEAPQRHATNPLHTSPTNSAVYGQPHPQQFQQMQFRNAPAPYPGAHSQQQFNSNNSMGSFSSIPDMAMGMAPRSNVPLSSGMSGFQVSYVSNDRALDEAARKAFDEADKDKSGYLDFKEFLDTLRTLEVNIAYHHALDRFATMDEDKDGRIRLSEFVNGYLSDQFITSKQHKLQQQQQLPMQQPSQWGAYPSSTQSQQTQQSHFQQQHHFPQQP